MDIAAADMDEVLAPKLGGERQPHFLDDQLSPRLAVYAAFSAAVCNRRPYVQALRRSVATWLPIQYAIRSKGALYH